MWLVNRTLGVALDVVLLPFRGVPAVLGLAAVSLVVSVVMLVVFRRVSDQTAIDTVKRRLQAGVYEIRLFKDDLRAIFAAQRDILKDTGRYFRLSLVPMLWMLVPLALVIAHLQFRYGYAALEPGQAAVVEVRVTEEGARRLANDAAALSIGAPEGVRVETPAVWIPSLREADWRIRAEEPGTYELVIGVGEERLTKSVHVAGGTAVRSPVRPSGLLRQLAYPAEAPIARDSQVEAIRVNYRTADVNLFGWRTHWMIAFVILTTVFAFALARPMGVKI
jgi:hypothetical protein